MRKKKAVKKKWCPLTGLMPIDDISIIRARAFWGIETIVKDNIAYFYIPGKEAIERAGRIYGRCFELSTNGMFLFGLKMAINNPCHKKREEYEDDILFHFRDLHVSPFEVFSIMAIYAALIPNNSECALALLVLTEKYSSDALRGKKVMTGAKTSGAGRAAQIKDERAHEWAAWQEHAEEIWRRNPNFTKSAVACIIEKKTGNPKSTIRQRILKPPEKS